MRIDIAAEHEGNALKPTDFPYLTTNLLVVSERAAPVFAELGPSVCEVLPLVSADGTYAWVNTLAVLDALDEANSQVSRFADGRLMAIHQHAFDETRLAGATLFRLTKAPSSMIYLTDDLLARIAGAGFDPPEVKQVWP